MARRVVIAVDDQSGVATPVDLDRLQTTNAFTYKGAINCSTNPNWPAASAGDVYKVSVAGKVGGASGQTVQVGDVLICNTAGSAGTDAAVGANWMIEQGNIVSTADVPASANKNYVTDAQLTVIGNTSGANSGDSASVPASYLDTDTSLAANSDVKVATQKAAKAYVDAHSGGITNSAGANVVPKSNGTNLVASRITDDGTEIEANSGTLGSFYAGDVDAAGNGLQLYIADSENYITLGAGKADVMSSGLLIGTATVKIGDANSITNGTRLRIDLPSKVIEIDGGSGADLFTVDGTAHTVTALAGTESIAIDGTAHTITATAASGFIASGTPTNDSAAAGKVGEILTASLASASATSLSTGTAKTITSLSLTAGDWDVWGIADYIPAATTTTAYVQQGISQTDNTLGAQDTFTACSGGNLSGTVLGSLIAENTPHQRISLASTTTIYLIGKASFAISTLTAYGSIFARRRR